MPDSTKSALPVGHVRLPAATLGTLSMLLVFGLHALGLLPRMNAWIATCVKVPGDASLAQALPPPLIWGAALAIAFGLSFSILSVAGMSRRILLVISSWVIIAGWAPVLSLAARAPEIGAPFIAALWAGICALVYASRHAMEADVAQESSSSTCPPP